MSSIFIIALLLMLTAIVSIQVRSFLKKQTGKLDVLPYGLSEQKNSNLQYTYDFAPASRKRKLQSKEI